MTVRTQNSQIPQPMVIAIPILMVELKHQRLPVPLRSNKTHHTKVLEKSFLNQPLLQALPCTAQ